MWLLVLEMFLALGVIVFIMWWTMRARVDHPVKLDEDDKKDELPKPPEPPQSS